MGENLSELIFLKNEGLTKKIKEVCLWKNNEGGWEKKIDCLKKKIIMTHKGIGFWSTKKEKKNRILKVIK